MNLSMSKILLLRICIAELTNNFLASPTTFSNNKSEN